MLAIVYICVTLKNNNIIVNYIICFSAVAFSIRFVSYDFSEGFIYLFMTDRQSPYVIVFEALIAVVLIAVVPYSGCVPTWKRKSAPLPSLDPKSFRELCTLQFSRKKLSYSQTIIKIKSSLQNCTHTGFSSILGGCKRRITNRQLMHLPFKRFLRLVPWILEFPWQRWSRCCLLT